MYEAGGQGEWGRNEGDRVDVNRRGRRGILSQLHNVLNESKLLYLAYKILIFLLPLLPR